MSGRKMKKNKVTEKVDKRKRMNRLVKYSSLFGDAMLDSNEIKIFTNSFVNQPIWFGDTPRLSETLNALPFDTHRPQRLALLLAFFLRCMQNVGNIMLEDLESNYKNLFDF